MDEEAWPSVLARTRQRDQAALHQVLAWLQQDDGKKMLRKHLQKKGVPDQSLEDAAADVQTAVLAELADGKFRGNSCGEFVLYVGKICRTYARPYRKWTREIPASASSAQSWPRRLWAGRGRVWGRRALRPTNPPDADPKTPFEFLPDDTAPDPETEASLRKDLTAALARVSERYAAAWSLRCVEGYSFEEIAKFMRCDPTRARKLVSEARQALGGWMTFLALVVDIHLTPSSPVAGQQVESWLALGNNGYDDVRGLRVTLQVDKHRLGHQATDVPQHDGTIVRGFTPWTRRQGRQTVLAMWALGGKKASKTHAVEDS